MDLKPVSKDALLPAWSILTAPGIQQNCLWSDFPHSLQMVPHYSFYPPYVIFFFFTAQIPVIPSADLFISDAYFYVR